MIATCRFLTKFGSAAAVILAVLAVAPPDPRRSTHRTKGDRTTCL